MSKRISIFCGIQKKPWTGYCWTFSRTNIGYSKNKYTVAQTNKKIIFSLSYFSVHDFPVHDFPVHDFPVLIQVFDFAVFDFQVLAFHVFDFYVFEINFYAPNIQGV